MIRPPPCTALASLSAPEDLDPPGAVERLRSAGSPWLLESALQAPGIGRFSFAGADPYLILRCRGLDLHVECRRAVYEGLTVGTFHDHGPALPALRALLPPAPGEPCALPFCGGAVGVFGYELAEQLDVHRLSGRDDLELPDAVWLFVDALVGFDHERGRAEILGLGAAHDPATARERAECAARGLAERLALPAPHARAARTAAPDGAHSHLDVAAYHKAVGAIADEIAAGELYQACLTYRIDRPFGGDPWQLFRALRRRDPAPFAAYLELPELAVAGSSPERFLRIDASGRVESRPIKGTAARGSDPASDARARHALASSEKDRAENLMIVDLVRNDLGRVCAPGTVAVPELFAVEPYASVFQLVSTVCGQLRPGCDALDAVAAAFPPGSMTGAPKIAAMRALDRLETVRRAFYSGALGYLDVRGGADLAVVIRTAFALGGRAYVHTGGGIVADSEPDAEYTESRAKLRSLLAALAECEPPPAI
ncbi:MAG TPA: aminodeoxychorismate synthase component I [Myxococcota bacterium]|nr:aminodeoxychorismate synthase component I [Myxococcota bacterium]